MKRAKHDEHFLLRLQRLEGEHAELALGLYYDHKLVEHILRVAKIPAAVERVALCLGEPEQGPHLIVARDGHFVTALGEGMSLQADQVVISRHQLDKISEGLESLRGLAADARQGGRGAIRRRFERIYEAGPGLSQEEFDELVRWLPLLRVDLLLNQMDMIERCHTLVAPLAGRKRYNRRQRDLVHEYWRSSWAAAHLSLLLLGDGGIELRKLFDKVELFELADQSASLTMAWTMVRLGTTNFALRGAWLASKMPKQIVPAAKRRYLGDEVTLLSTLTDSLCLSAVGMRHQKYRAEVGKVLERGVARDGPFQPIRELAAAYYEVYGEKPETARETAEQFGMDLLRATYVESGITDEKILDQLVLPHAMAVLMGLPEPYIEDPRFIAEMYKRLAWIVEVEARDFYLPEPHVRMLRAPYTFEDGKFLTDARIAAQVHKPAPVRREGPKIGRNQPCPCGSGKKYKRCCWTE